jgi:hypothetical protein
VSFEFASTCQMSSHVSAPRAAHSVRSMFLRQRPQRSPGPSPEGTTDKRVDLGSIRHRRLRVSSSFVMHEQALCMFVSWHGAHPAATPIRSSSAEARGQDA